LLARVMDGMVETVHDRVTQEMQTILEEEKTQEVLSRVERLLYKFERLDQEEFLADKQDREGTMEMLDGAKLAEGIRPLDIVTHHADKVMQEEKGRLLREIETVEAETKELEREVEKAEKLVRERVQTVEAAQQELNQTADICSTVS